MSAVEIRPVTIDDVERLRACVGAVVREGRYLAFTEPFALTETAVHVARGLEAGHPHFVAFDGATLVGWCDVTAANRPVYAHVGVLGMGVAAPCRRRGIGQRLVEAALAAARPKWEQIQLSVYASNTPAQALYRKVGFVERGRLPKGRKVGNRYDDVILMSLLFENSP